MPRKDGTKYPWETKRTHLPRTETTVTKKTVTPPASSPFLDRYIKAQNSKKSVDN